MFLRQNRISPEATEARARVTIQLARHLPVIRVGAAEMLAWPLVRTHDRPVNDPAISLGPGRPLELVLRPRRRRTLFLLLISAGFTATGALMIGDGQPAGWLVAGSFGLGLVVALVSLLPRAAYLRLTPGGFMICSLFRPAFIDWTDVATFGVASVGLNRMVGFNYAPGYRRAAAIRGFSRTIAGFEGALPNTYGMTPARLAALMTAYRAHALSSRQCRQP